MLVKIYSTSRWQQCTFWYDVVGKVLCFYQKDNTEKNTILIDEVVIVIKVNGVNEEQQKLTRHNDNIER